jgi:Tetratricopeptide repeat
VGGTQGAGVRGWLSAARHPAGRDGLIAVGLLVAPWVLVWLLAPHHHLDATAVAILAAGSIGLSTLWLTWAAYRASRTAPAEGGAGPGTVTAGPGAVAAGPGGSVAGHLVAAAGDLNLRAASGGVAGGVIHGDVTAAGPGSVVAGPGGTAIGQAAYQPRRGVTGKPVRLADPPPLLAGREGLLAELDARLAGEGDRGPRTVMLSGLGGAGKTSVALTYAHDHLGEVGVAWQLAAEDATVLAAGFAELAAQLGARDEVDIRDPVASVHGTLAAFRQRWLLIFDNAPDRPAVAPFLPPAGPGRVLITSRNSDWPPGQVLDVPMLDPETAAGFLMTRTGDKDEQAATELAKELGGLPLALEQAGAYVQASGGSLAGYLALFVGRRPEMLARGETGEYGKTVATTWSLAFTELEQSAPQAAGLLRFLAFCAPEPVPVRLLLQPRPAFAEKATDEVAAVLEPLLEEELATGDAVAGLRRYSLVTPAGDGLVLVHRLVQAVTADQMPGGLCLAWQQAVAALIEAAIPVDPRLPESWVSYALLLPHAQAALPDDSDGMARLASYLGWRGSYAAGLDLQQRVLAARERSLGAEHPATLAVRANLAFWTGRAGDAAGARDQFAALLPIRERVLGAEHPDTLTTRANLARWTGAAGDAAGARDQLAALLPIQERVLGAEYPTTLNARGNLAAYTGEAGNATGARDQFAALLPIRERVLGPGHPATLTTRANLAFWTGEAGNATGARDQLTALLPIRERVLGPGHPATLITRANLAFWTGEAGDATGACDQLTALLPIYERVLGAEHPDTLTTRANLAYWTQVAAGGTDPAVD